MDMSVRQDNFKNGYFWELYQDLELQLRDFLEYVPYLPENENVCSFKLLNMILSIGGHLDSAFKEIVRYKGYAKDPEIAKIKVRLDNWEKAWVSKRKIGQSDKVSMVEMFNVFEQKWHLSTREVKYKILNVRPSKQPFLAIRKDPLRGWWSIYNGLKHDVAVALKEATLANAWDALACAFILNVIHQSAVERLYDYNMLRDDYLGKGPGQDVFAGGLAKSHLADIAEKGTQFDLFIETPLFLYRYKQ